MTWQLEPLAKTSRLQFLEHFHYHESLLDFVVDQRFYRECRVASYYSFQLVDSYQRFAHANLCLLKKLNV